jgi:hypothetical protein
MTERLPGRNDPFEGRGAIRARRRLRATGLVALGLAVLAVGLTAAAWLRLLLPFAS